MVLFESATSIVSAYVANNTVQKEILGSLISDVFRSLSQMGQRTAPVEDLKPAVPIKRSVQPDHIVCLEDGKTFKSLKRHLMSHYNMTPEEYRDKWGLPHDYPMVAPNYAQARSDLAKKMGLGQRRAPVESATEPKAAARSSKKAPAGQKGEVVPIRSKVAEENAIQSDGRRRKVRGPRAEPF
jgi:predicted transcriptional regulator